MPIEVVGASIGPGRPGERRNRIDNLLKIALARADCVFGPFPIVNVRQEHAPANDAGIGISNRRTATLKPSIHAVDRKSAAQFRMEFRTRLRG